MNKKTLEAIRKHALEEYPRESCGLVLNVKGKEVYHPCRNLSQSNDSFVMCHKDRDAAEDKGEILMVVHSHPDESCKPSEADRAMCEESEIPWFILSVYKDLITGEMNTEDYTITHPEGFVAPLEGRVWAPPVMDCFSLINDYYKQKLGVILPVYELEKRSGLWWENEEEESLYLKHYEDAGFVRVDGSPKEHDVIIMELGSKAGPNHAGIYLGDESGHFLHHLYGYLSGRAVYGGYWLRNTRLIVRHKELM